MTSQETQPAERIINAMTAELSNATVHDIEGEIFCFEAMFPNYAGEPGQDPLKVFKATADPDTMYMHEAMRQKDADEFKKAMLKEWKDQFENGNFSIIHVKTLRLAQFQWIFQLQVYRWQTELLGESNPIRHCIHNPSVCKILNVSKGGTWSSDKMVGSIPEGNSGQRNNPASRQDKGFGGIR